MIIITDGFYEIPKSDIYTVKTVPNIESFLNGEQSNHYKLNDQFQELLVYCLGNKEFNNYDILELVTLFEKLPYSKYNTHIILPYGSSLDTYDIFETHLSENFMMTIVGKYSNNKSSISIKDELEDIINQ